ncbi:potassium transporter [Heterobasidion irregulare TC 32-1]|uniref:Potassium transporter n=1 Tax=Heterobasidion irregulare (strain TC 32-1) TaxID=747525 RepID=W4K8U3_HETIT|nr:potassium transporter [Heterobasidion irregulare TC 32-1]ETW82203.1 potassium transporter [Heterobasidion irregulare TC 32-1]
MSALYVRARAFAAKGLDTLNLNFYRLHLLYFTIAPFILAAVAYACNGMFPASYLDLLFCCVSAMTGTGLATLDLSSLTAWQQAVLVILEIIGSPVTISFIVVYVRRRYFQRHLHWIVESEFERTKTRDILRDAQSDSAPKRNAQFKPSMIRRVDTLPKPISSSMDMNAMFLDFSSSIPEHHIAGQTFGHSDQVQQRVNLAPRRELTRRTTIEVIDPNHNQDDEFGGFRNPLELIARLFRRLFPNIQKKLKRSMTMPTESKLVPDDTNVDLQGDRPVSYFSFNARVRKNSVFYGLSDSDCEELGGVEYRALTALLWIVPLYAVGSLGTAFVVTAPYMSLARWKDNFQPPQQHRVINPVWYSIFEVIGAWANTGLSLVDQGLIPFQTAYPMLIFLIWVVIAGNTGYPVLWGIFKSVPKTSQMRETLQFLLDHPRRCFIYLFPSRQTWFLLIMLIFLNLTDWFLFLVLDIGNATVEAIPVGTRLIVAAVQAVAVRLAGFQSVPIAVLAPAVKVLYVVMIVRSTNVYEERSLGVSETVIGDDGDIEDEANYPQTDSRVAIWGRYLGRHVKRQLAFDMWWLALALFLICIIEKNQLSDSANESWFNLFSMIFEIVSAYATVGLSLGIPTANFSLSGAMHALSKLILCAVMIRGRHRGLPVALDRAIMLPKEFLDMASEKALQMKRRQVGQSRDRNARRRRLSA